MQKTSPKRRPRAKTPFAKILQTLMSEHRIGVREAAKAAGVAPSVIVSWRSGANPEDFAAVKRLAKMLGVSMSFLLTGEQDYKPVGTGAVTEVFQSAGTIFDGFAKITIERLVPREQTEKEK